MAGPAAGSPTEREAALLSTEVLSLQRDGTLRLSAEHRGCLSKGCEIVTIHGRLRGVEIEEPVLVAFDGARGLEAVLGADELPPAGGFAEPNLSMLQAIAAVDAVGTPGSAGARTAQLVWARTPVGLRLSWIVDPPLDMGHMRNPVYRVDAMTGHVSEVTDRVAPVAVRAYPENPVTTPQPEVFDLVQIDEGAQTLSGPLIDVQSCLTPEFGTWPGTTFDRCELTRWAEPDLDGNFLGFEPQTGFILDDAFAETSVYYHADKFLDAMTELGLPGLFCDQELDQRSMVVTNYHFEDGVPYENANYTGWCPVALVFGQGRDDDYAYDGDLVYHEVGHAVVHHQTPTYIGRARGLPHAWVNDANAINEAVADFLSTTMTDDPIVAESVIDRNIDTEASCPASLDGTRYNDSLPVSGALWQLGQALGDAFTPVVLDALTALPQDATYEDFTEALALASGASLGPDAEAMVRAHFEGRGLAECERVLVYDGSVQPIVIMAELGLEPFTPPPLQYVVEIPPQTARVAVEYLSVDWDGAGVEADVAWRVGAPVEYTYSGEDGNQVEAIFDDGRTGLPFFGTLEIQVDPSPAETSLYLAFVNPGSETRLIGLESVDFVPAPPGSDTDGTSTGSDPSTSSGSTGIVDDGSTGGIDPSTGTSGEPAEPAAADDGCSCRCGSAPPASLALLLLVLLRRRRAATRLS